MAEPAPSWAWEAVDVIYVSWDPSSTDASDLREPVRHFAFFQNELSNDFI